MNLGFFDSLITNLEYQAATYSMQLYVTKLIEK